MKQRFSLKNTSILCLFLFMLIGAFIVFNTKFKEHDSENISAWTYITPVPFSGYLCNYSESNTFLQLPFFIPKEYSANTDLSEIIKITLVGADITLNCTDYKISSYKELEHSNSKLGTLSFRMNLPKSGTYYVDNIELTLKSGEKIKKPLDKLTIRTIEKEEETNHLEMREFIVNQSQGTSFKVSYFNTTSENIEVVNMSFPIDIYSELEIKKYTDFALTTMEDDLIVPPNEERTFTFSFSPTQKYIQAKQHYFYMLPFITYFSDGKMVTATSQTQATIVQTPFTDEIIKNILSQ